VKKSTKNQHYVWRYYLQAWAVGGNFVCYRRKERKLFPTQPKAIASQTYFYQIERLTTDDMAFLTDFINKATDHNLRNLNHEYVRLTQLTFRLFDRLKTAAVPPHMRTALNDELKWAAKNLVETYHAGVEIK
jgi:hypothetical protein